MKIGVFGKRLLGEEEYNRQQAIVERRSHVYGPRVTGESKATNLPGERVVESLSVRALENLVGKNPHMVERALSAELRRPDGTRITALRFLKEAEEVKDKPDPEILETIDTEIEAYEVRLADEADPPVPSAEDEFDVEEDDE